MAYTVKLGTFAKNIESTAQPTTTGWAEYSVTLKNGADISNPQLEISAAWSTVKDYNYAVMMDRYYWIVGKNMLRENFCVLDLKVDVLATYKTEIGSSSLYILRSSASSNGNVQDNLYPPTADIVYSTETEPNFPGYTYATGSYVLNIMGTSTAGTSTLWQLTPANFAKLMEELYVDINGFQLSDAVKIIVQKFGGNPTQLISGCLWFPMDFPAGQDSLVRIGGWQASTAYGAKITNPVKNLPGFNPTIAAHPQASRGRYLNLAPYSKYQLYIPGAGIINLDTTELKGINKIYVTRHVDAFTGRMFCLVQTDPDSISDPYHYLAAMEGQWGIPISLNGTNNGGSVVSGALGTIGAVAGAIATGGATAIVGAATAAIGTIANAVGNSPSNCSTGGAIVSMLEPMRLDTTFYKVVDEDNARNGRPLCQVTTPATLGGFMIAQKGDVVMAGPLPEHEEVKRYLETGFFYE